MPFHDSLFVPFLVVGKSQPFASKFHLRASSVGFSEIVQRLKAGEVAVKHSFVITFSIAVVDAEVSGVDPFVEQFEVSAERPHSANGIGIDVVFGDDPAVAHFNLLALRASAETLSTRAVRA